MNFNEKHMLGETGLPVWMIGRIRIPMLVVQEGGYNNRTIGNNAKSFFHGLMSGII